MDGRMGAGRFATVFVFAGIWQPLVGFGGGFDFLLSQYRLRFRTLSYFRRVIEGVLLGK